MIAAVRKTKSKFKRDLNKTQLFSPQNNPRSFLNTQEWRIARPCRLLVAQDPEEVQMPVSKKRNTLTVGKASILSSSLQVPKDKGLINHANVTMTAVPKLFHNSSEESRSLHYPETKFKATHARNKRGHLFSPQNTHQSFFLIN